MSKYVLKKVYQYPSRFEIMLESESKTVEVFVHYSAIKAEGRRRKYLTLTDGEPVEYTLEVLPDRSVRCKTVRRLDVGHAQVSRICFYQLLDSDTLDATGKIAPCSECGFVHLLQALRASNLTGGVHDLLKSM